MTAQARPLQRPDGRQVGDLGLAIYFVLNGRPLAMARDCFDSAAAICVARPRDRGHAPAETPRRRRHDRGAFSGFAALPPAPHREVLGLEPGAQVQEVERRFAARPRRFTRTWAPRPPPWQSSMRPGSAPSEIEV
jgi:hypothetical protein